MKPKGLIATLVVGVMQFTLATDFTANAQNGVLTIDCEKAGTFGQKILQTTENLSDVVSLTVTGHLNTTDLMYLSRMYNLQVLDLTGTDITEMTGCNDLESLTAVWLPETVTKINAYAFSNCSSLSSIEFTNIVEIGNYAFQYCSSLSGELGGEKVKTIGDYAFQGHLNITSISFPAVESIGDNAFESGSYNHTHAKLEKANLPSLKKLGRSAFFYCENLKSVDIRNCTQLGKKDDSYASCFQYCNNLTEIKLSDDLEIIPGYTFNYTGLTEIKFPSNLKEIYDNAFSNSPLTEIILPEGLESIGSSAFENCPMQTVSLPSTLISVRDNSFYVDSYLSNNLSEVYCHAVAPLQLNVFSNEQMQNASLFVPQFSVNAYKLDEHWYRFNQISGFDSTLSEVNINASFLVMSKDGLTENPDFYINSNEKNRSAGHLTLGLDEPFHIGSFIQSQHFVMERNYYYDENYNYQEYYSYPYCTTVIANSEIKADRVISKIKLQADTWSFISLPYDVKVSEIKKPDNVMWVVRKYNGANRAAMTGETWEDITAAQTLKAGEGYIIHCIIADDDYDGWDAQYVEFEFPAADNATKNNIFRTDDYVASLEAYPAEFSHNRGWNLIGNPYPSFFDIRYMDFQAPITIWNGNGYTAYSPVDDGYKLHPNEAFFVQCPINTDKIIFSEEGRSHEYILSTEDYYNTRTRSVGPISSRTLLNFILRNSDYSDRARLVINEEASTGYETDKDAVKFMSENTEVPQVYIIDNGINYAIDERPLGTGEFVLGIYIGKEDSYTLSLSSVDSDYSVTLTDRQSGETVNLNEEEYVFTSGEGEYTGRFLINVAPKETSSVENLSNENIVYSINGNSLTFDGDNQVSVISIDGKMLYQGKSGNIELPSGIYILHTDKETRKIAIK